jgi:hypothetical protein
MNTSATGVTTAEMGDVTISNNGSDALLRTTRAIPSLSPWTLNKERVLKRLRGFRPEIRAKKRILLWFRIGTYVRSIAIRTAPSVGRPPNVRTKKDDKLRTKTIDETSAVYKNMRT